MLQVRGKKHMSVKVILLGLLFLACLAILDFRAMNLTWNKPTENPTNLYLYWIALTTTVIVFSFTVSLMLYFGGADMNMVFASFFTIILLYIGGFLDIFFYLIATAHGYPYSFDVWSAQYKWFGYWDWTHQILWTSGCLVVILLLWYFMLKRKVVRMR